jgi:hypothetical protein
VSVILENVDNNFGPFGVDTVVRVVLLDLGKRWQLWVEVLWDFEQQHDSPVQIFLNLFNLLLVVEEASEFVVKDPSHQEAVWVDAVELMHSLSKIGDSISFSKAVDVQAVVVVGLLVLRVLNEVALEFLPFGQGDWQLYH